MKGSWFDVPGGDTSPVCVILPNGEAFFRLIEQ
jgi:hypothetical protein